MACSAHLVMFSSLLYCEFGSKMTKIALAHLTADTQMFPCCVHPSVIGIRPIRHRNLCLSKSERLLHSRQFKLDLCSAHNCLLQNHDSLNQNKHLGSIIPRWKPLIGKSQSTLSRAGLSTELCVCFKNSALVHGSSHKHTSFDLSVWFEQKRVHSITVDSSKFEMHLDQSTEHVFLLFCFSSISWIQNLSANILLIKGSYRFTVQQGSCLLYVCTQFYL